MLQRPGYRLDLRDDGTLTLHTADGSQPLLTVAGVPMLPVAGRAVLWGEATIEHSPQAVTWRFADNHLWAGARVTMELADDHVAVSFTGTALRRTAINKWYLLKPGSEIHALECLDFRSHIDSPSAYRTHQTILGRRKLGTIGLDANTEDSDLMFAPHPMLFVFQHLEDRLVVAPTGLVAGESLHVKMVKGSTIIDDFHVEVGRDIYWVEAGETVESPRFMFMPDRGGDIYDSLAKYTAILVREGRIKPKRQEDLEPWMLSPMWCSWGDQHHILDSAEVIHLAVTKEMRAKAVDNISDAMVNKVAAVIEQHQLPVRTLIIDDRWYTKQGDMFADTRKFPDFRGTIDGLHQRGFKVLAWSSLYQFDTESEVYKQHPEWFLLHHYHRNPHSPKDIPCLDYSNQEIAETYLGELLTRLLSDKPGCYNLDGIKFDWPFLLPHNYPFADRDWVGKEKTIHHTQKRIYDIAKRIKPGALIIGVSPHPFFQDTQDIIRTYDVSTYDIRIHLERARYVRAIAPGMLPAMDEHVYFQNFFSYLEEGSKLGIPMLYNLIRFNGDGHVNTPEDYRRMKQMLDAYVARTPALRDYLAKLG